MNTYKVLGQAQAVAADTDYTLYTVPALTSVALSKVTISAKTANSKFRISIVPSGDTLADKHAIAYDELVELGRGRSKLEGITLAAGAQVVVRANTAANVSFSLFGSEIS